MSEPDQFDVCKSRHRGNAQSIKANPSASSKTRDRDAVYGLIASNGITSKEIAEAMGKVDLSKPYLTTQEAESHRNRCPNPIGMGVRTIFGITVRIEIGTGVRLTSEYAAREDSRAGSSIVKASQAES